MDSNQYVNIQHNHKNYKIPVPTLRFIDGSILRLLRVEDNIDEITTHILHTNNHQQIENEFIREWLDESCLSNDIAHELIKAYIEFRLDINQPNEQFSIDYSSTSGQYGPNNEVETHDLSSLNDLPIGYEFYVENGGWHGKIVEVDDVKYIYVFEKDAFFNLTEAQE